MSTLRSLVLPAAVFFVGLAVCFVVVGGIAHSRDLPSGIWITEVLVFLVPSVLFVRAVNLTPASFLRVDVPLSRGVLLLVFFASAANYLFAAGLMGVLEVVLPESWRLVAVEDVLGAERGLRLFIVLAGVGLAAPVCEEVAFRGVLQQPLVARFGPVAGLVVTAFFFSALHADPVGLLPRFELGLFFGWLFLRTGSLWAPVLAHAVNNIAASVLFLLLRGEGPAAPATAEDLPALAGFVALGALLLAPALVVIRRSTSGVVTEPERLVPDEPVGVRAGSPEVLVLLLAAFSVFLALLSFVPPS